VNDGVIDLATKLVASHPLRTLDAVHLATSLLAGRFLDSLDLGPVVFVSADDRLLEAADAEGLRTENPNGHG
jgi:predicted nucleic acid-binding protein